MKDDNILQDLLNELSNKLYNEFGSKYNIYFENVEQGFNVPCFYISIIDYTHNNLLENNRNLREKENINLEVVFFPINNNNKKEQLILMAKPLSLACERINLYNKPIRSNISKINFIDDTVQVLFSFDFNTISKYKKDFMTKLKEREVLINGRK